MKEHRAILKEVHHPDLHQPPHHLDWLVDMVLGTQHNDPSQFEQVEAHLAECEYCRTASIILLAAEVTYEGDNDTIAGEISHFWTQFVKIHRASQALGHEQLTAYAEAIVAEGKEEADKCFPIIAKHIDLCHRCRAIVEDVVDFIKMAEGIESPNQS